MTDSRVAELVERAFDYRGYITLRRSDGSELVGFVYDRSTTHVELFDEAAAHRVRVPLTEVADIAFTGEDAARKSQQMWERRKGTLEPRDTSAWGEWRESGPILVLVALDGELRSVARAFGLSRRGNLARGRFSGTDVAALAVGVGGGARGAVIEEQPRLVVSCGFSGGLDPALAPGDLVLATAVRDETGDELVAPRSVRRQALRALHGLRCRALAPREISCSSPAAPASPPLRWKWPFAGSVRCWWSRRHTREGARHRRQRLHRRRGGAGAAAPGNSRPGPAPPGHGAERPRTRRSGDRARGPARRRGGLRSGARLRRGLPRGRALLLCRSRERSARRQRRGNAQRDRGGPGRGRAARLHLQHRHRRRHAQRRAPRRALHAGRSGARALQGKQAGSGGAGPRGSPARAGRRDRESDVSGRRWRRQAHTDGCGDPRLPRRPPAGVRRHGHERDRRRRRRRRGASGARAR